MSSAYATTTVPVEKSRSELRDMLRRYGATRFSFTEDDEHSFVEVTFRHSDLRVRMRVHLRALDDDEAADVARRSRTRTLEMVVADHDEQEARRVWRVLYWLLKTRMEAIAAGVETFAEAFLPHIVYPATGETVYESMTQAGAMAQLEAGEGS